MSLRGRLLLAFGYVLLVAIVAFEVPLALNTADRIDSEVRAQASAQADLLAVAAAGDLAESRADLQALAEVSAESVRGRVIVVDASGELLADSEGGASGSDYSNRPEIAAALQGERFQRERGSADLGMDIIATSAPMIVGDEVVGAVRVTQSTSSENRAILDSIGGLILIGAVVLVIGLLAAVLVARQLSEPLQTMTATTRRIAAGDLEQRVEPSGSREQRQLAEAFNEMTERLAASLKRQQQFVADASHQLRTPLTGLRLRIEEAQALIEEGAGGPENDHETMIQLEAAVGEVDRLAELVAEMLKLSRVGEQGSDVSELGLGALIRAAAERWAPAAEQKGIELRVEATDAGSTRCGAAEAERALDALIENAILYSPSGSTILLEAAPQGIAVIDAGPGIDGEDRERVFERFYRGSAGRSGPHGTGLGLPIARGLARAWGGDVTLSSEPGEGTRALLAFPPGAAAVVGGGR